MKKPKAKRCNKILKHWREEGNLARCFLEKGHKGRHHSFWGCWDETSAEKVKS